MMKNVPIGIVNILHALREGGYQAYLVGGCVRDRLLGFEPGDYDVCTSALPEEMKKCFGDGFRTYDSGIKHGTLTVLSGEDSAEVTTFRLDGGYTDGRHPDKVSFTRELAEDLSRRDFTVNAMALSAEGEIVDLFGGRADLTAGVIRAVGEPAVRFGEDALRILRALRFASRLGFEIEEKTSRALHECAHLLSLVSRERIAVELFGIVMGKGAERIVDEYSDVIACAGVRPSSVDADLPFDKVIRMAALLREDREGVCSLKLSNKLRDEILALTDDYNVRLPYDESSALYLMHQIGYEGALRLCRLRMDATAESVVSSAKKGGKPYTVGALAVNGSHLMQAGYAGKEIGEILGRILREIMDGKLVNRKDEIMKRLKKSP